MADEVWLDATCPCCGYKTISTDYEICSICAWEYDRTVTHPDDFGCNSVSLREAQRNFQRFGAMSEKYLDMVDKPGPDDIRDPEWKPFDPPTD